MSERIEATVTRDGFHVTVSAAPDYDACPVELLAESGAVVQTYDRGWNTLEARPRGGWTFTPAGDRGEPQRPPQCDGGWAVVEAAGVSQGDAYRVWYRLADHPDRAAFEAHAQEIMNGITSAYHLSVKVRAVPGGTVIGAAALGGCWLEYREADAAGILAHADGYGLVDEAIAEARHAAARIAAALTAEAAAVAALVGGAA